LVNALKIAEELAQPNAQALTDRPDVALTIAAGVPSEHLAGANHVLDEEGVAEFKRNVRATDDQMARISFSKIGRDLMASAPDGCRSS